MGTWLVSLSSFPNWYRSGVFQTGATVSMRKDCLLALSRGGSLDVVANHNPNRCEVDEPVDHHHSDTGKSMKTFSIEIVDEDGTEADEGDGFDSKEGIEAHFHEISEPDWKGARVGPEILAFLKGGQPEKEDADCRCEERHRKSDEGR